jgi:hypothetical protein
MRGCGSYLFVPLCVCFSYFSSGDDPEPKSARKSNQGWPATWSPHRPLKKMGSVTEDASTDTLSSVNNDGEGDSIGETVEPSVLNAESASDRKAVSAESERMRPLVDSIHIEVLRVLQLLLSMSKFTETIEAETKTALLAEGFWENCICLICANIVERRRSGAEAAIEGGKADSVASATELEVRSRFGYDSAPIWSTVPTIVV